MRRVMVVGGEGGEGGWTREGVCRQGMYFYGGVS